jgi:methylated-DNA-[protein]-cysteine S-methyltransferase
MRTGAETIAVMGQASEPLGCACIDLPAVAARLWIRWGARGLQRMSWCEPGSDASAAFDGAAPEEAPLPEPYAGVLHAYLAGEPVDPLILPVELEGTPFQCKVWHALRGIPRGNVRSYAAIANVVGAPRAMRAVGGANGRNPIAIVVPCHRVVAAGMRLGGYSGGLDRKRFLLKLEGVSVDADLLRPGQLDLI